MKQTGRNWLAVIAVLIFGFILFYTSTDGFRAFTTEAARTYELTQTQPEFPNVTLQDSKGESYKLNDFSKDKFMFVTFMYTNCTTVCPQLEMNMSEVYKQIPSEYIGEDIVFLSISFDPENDDPKTLEKYRSYFDSNGETWRMARVKDQKELEQMLDRLGVVVIPDGYGNFQHNTAFYLIGRDGHLLEVMDFTKIDEAADTVQAYLEGGIS
ncbi:SCO family protein [Virgibacillus sp. MSP4-1]|uniref:SCO family protein n=1 Tax=Virgibacillus sp. MSP4-1 TaxID=2700081 RepID=UPI0003A92F6D|nr:SCO family protein [Virgibacillus sp. MSP4-1]QHS24029.1 SCO family protein [Virgibacillus sp. MSP4-1]